jgi:hypothetical protein
LGAQDEKTRVAQEVYAALVDAAVEACDFENWNQWASRVIGNMPRWSGDAAATVYGFRMRIIGAAWPGTNPELERALKTLSLCINASAQRFLEETESRGEERVEVKYYNQRAFEKSRYDFLFNRWQNWSSHMVLLVRQATRAANWVAEVVRRDLNPAFFAVSGKFTLTEPSDLSFVTHLPEFSEEQKLQLPDGLDLKQPEPPDDEE